MTTWRDEYPFESRYLTIPGLNSTATSPQARIHYIDQSTSLNPSQTILCVHGNPTWSFYYRSIVSRFQSTTRVVAVDNLGCGLSDKPANYDYCLRNHTSNLIHLIDQLDLKHILLVVHDWGGAIGLGAAIARSDRVDKLTILNTAAFVPPYIPRRIAACRIPVLGSLAIRYANAFAWTATFMAVDRLKKMPVDTKAGLLFPYQTPADRVAIDRFVQDIPMRKSHRTWEVLTQLEQSLPTLAKKPATLVWGMKDWCFRPECLDRLSLLLPQAKVQKLEDVGHYVMEEAPTEVGDAIQDLLNTKV